MQCNEEGDKIAMRRRFSFGGSVPWHDLIMNRDTDKDVTDWGLAGQRFNLRKLKNVG